MENKKIYFPEVDVVKGVAILLVILGHSFCQYSVNVGAHFPLLGSVVRSFQMPLFFIASGFLFTLETPFVVFLKKKAKRLIVPFFVFALLNVGLRYMFSSVTHGGSIVLTDALWDVVQGHNYWFLYSLMWIMTVTLLVKNKIALLVLASLDIICCLLTDIESLKLFTIGRTVYYFPFFIVGMLLRQGYAVVKRMTLNSIVVTTLLLIFGYMLAMMYGTVGENASAYLIGLFGSFAVWFTTLPLTAKCELKPLKHFGRYSLQYYLNHLLIMLPCYYIGGKLFTPPHFAIINNLDTCHNL